MTDSAMAARGTAVNPHWILPATLLARRFERGMTYDKS